MGEPYLGEIKMTGFSFPPKNWAQCDGQVLPINDNTALFALLGTAFGGNGTTNFALPDMRGRTPMHTGTGFFNDYVTRGQKYGYEKSLCSTTNCPVTRMTCTHLRNPEPRTPWGLTATGYLPKPAPDWRFWPGNIPFAFKCRNNHRIWRRSSTWECATLIGY